MTTLSNILAAGFRSDLSVWQEAGRFVRALFDAQFTSTDCVIWGAILLGITCGVLGCFIVLRRQSLLGDAIGHAVLPGVCAAFLVAYHFHGAGARSTPVFLVGAMIAGILAAALISLLQRTTNLKTGECMGVVFTGFYADLPGTLRAMDVLVQPSVLDEGLPTSILEAQALGLPVVASDVGGVPESIEHTVTGLLVPKRDDDAIASAIRVIMDDDEMRESMGSRARLRIEKHFRLETMVRRVSETYDKAVAKHRQVK